MKTREKEPMVHLGARIPESMAARLDALIPSLSTTWHDANKSDALRLVLGRGLDVIEREAAESRK